MAPEEILNPLPGTVGAALVEGERRLERCGADLSPPHYRRHAELLLEAALNLDRTALYLNAREQLTEDQTRGYEELLKRREAGEPVQHIVGWAPFYGNKFLVGKGVFVPRFESEIIIDRCLERCDEDGYRNAPVEILDLCCGCGALGLTAAAELLHAHVTLTDISEIALEYCSRNALALLVNNRVEVVKWDALSEPLVDWFMRFHYVLANPPYIPPAELGALPPDVILGEPRNALTDGDDGFSFYRRWLETLPQIMRQGGRLFTECSDRGAAKTYNILAAAFTNLLIAKDINGVGRVVEGVVMEEIRHD